MLAKNNMTNLLVLFTKLELVVRKNLKYLMETDKRT